MWAQSDSQISPSETMHTFELSMIERERGLTFPQSH